jgi:hypothetical protein
MRKFLAGAAALALLAGCGANKDATAALAAMNITDGKAGTVQFSGKSMSGDKVTLKDVVLGGDSGTGVKAATLVMTGLDMSADGKPMVKSMTLTNVSPQQEIPGVTFNVATVTMGSTNEVTSSYIASAFTTAGPANPPEFKAWGLSDLTLKGLTIKGDLTQAGMSSGAFNVNLDELSVSDLKDTVFATGKLSGFKGDFDIPAEAGAGFPIKGTFDFGAMDVKGLRGGLFASAIQAGMAQATDPAAAASVNADFYAQLTSPIDPGFDELNWSGMNLAASGLTVTASKSESKVTRNAEGIATKILSPRATFNVATNAADGQLGQMVSMGLSMVGYQNLELYAEADAAFDPATDTTRYTKYNFGLTDGFDLSLQGGFQGLQQALVALMGSMDQMAMGATAGPDLSGLQALKVVDLNLSLTDKSLVNRLLNLAPMMGGSDPEQMRTDIVNMLSSSGADLTGAGVDPAISNELMAAVAEFVKKPGTLTITMKPAQPTALMAEGASLTKDSLGLTIKHTPAN